MDVPNDSSWTIRKVLSRRALGKPLIHYKIGNGLSTFLRMDNWHPVGPLYPTLGDNVVNNFGRSLQAKVSSRSIIHNGKWSWPRLRNMVIQTILRQNPSDFEPECDRDEHVVWLPHPSGIYSARSAWETIIFRLPVQNWTKVVWFKKQVPR